MGVIENIKKYGNKDKDYVPHEYATCYPLHTQDFVRTGFQDISYTLSARDYKDPKCVIVKRSETMETILFDRSGYVKQTDISNTLTSNDPSRTLGSHNPIIGVMETVRIKQATSQGYIECEVGGVADLSFPDSNTRRGGVQEMGRVSPTLMAGETDICRIEKEIINPLKGISGNGWHFEQNVYDPNGLIRSVKSESGSGNIPKVIEQYRIRKLTPMECWRLMDFKDGDFYKAAEVNSNTQLYKQAGNSIVRNVLVAIIGQMIPGKENVYKEETK